MRLFKTFYGKNNFFLYVLYIGILIFLYLFTNLSPDSNKLLNEMHITMSKILMLYGILAGVIIGVSDPYLPTIFTPRGEWYRTVGITATDILEYEVLHALVYASIPTIVIVLKGISIEKSLMYVFMPAIAVGLTFTTLKSALSLLCTKVNISASLVRVTYMVGGIALAGNIAQLVITYPIASSLTGLLIYILGNAFIIREVVS
ncbi:hypothetical protein GM182_05290 [bacterium 3DAC]|nr:hypothetical protein GM182_05290 [bacterium 3DAC]